MSGRWDTIVIGAGVGGLSAAARLVQAGLRVLVLEKNLHPGGTAYVYTRHGFSFPMGPLGFSTTDFVQNTLGALDQGQGLEFIPVHYQIRNLGPAITISLPFDQMIHEMGNRFPGDRNGIKQFFDDVQEILRALRSPGSETSPSVLKKAEKTSARDYLKGLIKDQRLRRVLGSLGTREPYTGLALLAAMWGLMCQDGIWYPKGGMRLFCDSLAGAVDRDSEQKAGVGKIDLGAEVEEIRRHQDGVAGVTLADGTTFDAATVISNADFKTTVLRLLKPRDVPLDWIKAVKGAKQTNSIFQVCLGIDTNKVDLSAFSNASRIIFQHGHSNSSGQVTVDWQAGQIDPDALAVQEMEVSLWSKEDATLAPKGAAVVVIRTEADYTHFSEYRPARGQRTQAYGPYKTRLGRALIRQAAHLIPGIEDAVEVFDVATPLTFKDRGGRSEGAVAGWSWDFKDNPGQPLELIRTPISGLFMAGYQAYSALFMGGVPTAMSSGLAAAEAVLQGTGPLSKGPRIPLG